MPGERGGFPAPPRDEDFASPPAGPCRPSSWRPEHSVRSGLSTVAGRKIPPSAGEDPAAGRTPSRGRTTPNTSIGLPSQRSLLEPTSSHARPVKLCSDDDGPLRPCTVDRGEGAFSARRHVARIARSAIRSASPGPPGAERTLAPETTEPRNEKARRRRACAPRLRDAACCLERTYCALLSRIILLGAEPWPNSMPSIR